VTHFASPGVPSDSPVFGCNHEVARSVLRCCEAPAIEEVLRIYIVDGEKSAAKKLTKTDDKAA